LLYIIGKWGISLFTVVDLKNEKTSKIHNFIQYFRKAEVNIKEIPLLSGKSYFISETKYHRGEIPWKDIEKNAQSENFILPFDLKDKSPLKEFEPKFLPELMLFNTALDYIKKMNPPPTKTRFTLVDHDGIFIENLAPVLKLASLITVITKEEKKYIELSDRLFEAYGISLMIRRDYHETKRENSFLFDYKGDDIPLSYKGTAFSKEKKLLLNGKTLMPGGFTMPSEYEKLWRKNTDKLQFASALYELCNVKELYNLRFNELCS
jgi:hypothetical protein